MRNPLSRLRRERTGSDDSTSTLPSRPGIFLNYRGADSSGHAGRLYDALATRFGEESVFMDLDAIPAGVDFPAHIANYLAASDVVLAVIGRQWVNAVDESGRRRLEDPSDFVRVDLETAMKNDVPLIPILVQGAAMPRRDDLPDVVSPIAYRNAVVLEDRDWRHDVNRLITSVERLRGEKEARARAERERVKREEVERRAAEKETAHWDPSHSASTWGWVLTGVSLLIPFAAIAAVVFGGLVISRSNGRRTGTGVAIIIAALIVGFFSFSFWAAATGA